LDPSPKVEGEGRWGERRLVREAQGGSSTAFERLFELHWRAAHRAAYLVVQDSAAAEDIAQEAFLSALRSLDRFDLRRPFGPWLHRIVVNRAIDQVRARDSRGEVPGEAADAAAAPAREGLSDATARAIGALPVEQRAVIVMRFLLDYRPGEIARALGLPRGTVNSRIRRGLDRLSTELGEEAS
jgi:RNA polymerase sigma-70 factor (ECF subfamily)